MEEKTICAISTPIGSGGISIIRLSGDNAKNIASKVFQAKLPIDKFEPNKLYLGSFNAKNFKDKCLCVYFKAPKSYTGEDVIEFQCHGGVRLANGIVAELIDNGAVMAEAGEFTKRAFLNGKVSLDEAEGVIDLINSETESQIKAGYELMQGNLRKTVLDLQKRLTTVLAKIDVSMDYPDEELETGTLMDTKVDLEGVREDLSNLLKTSKSGMTIKNGCKLVILGKTNAGKSSLMNSLLGFDRAIVTDIKGTTRDTLEESFEYKGVKFILVDTAGIREAKDRVEQIGIEKAKEVLNTADVILYVVDGSLEMDNEDEELMKLILGKKAVAIINKSDLKQKVDENILQKRFEKVMKISALENKGVMELKEYLYNLVIDEKSLSSAVMLTNTRHIGIVKEALKLTNFALDEVEKNLSLDLIALDIKNVWLKLGEITGETNTEEIIDEIFMKFCLGK